MSRKWIAYVVMPAVMLVLWGCPKKEPVTPEPELEVVTEPVEEPAEVPEPEPPPVEDMVEPGLPTDLVELNAVIQERGLIGDVFFEFDKADLDEADRQRLSDNARFMRENPDLIFTIEGHCDERGTNEYNLALGNRRANSAKDYLLSLGISEARLRTISYGEERPFCTESDEGCWARNRRAHFVATGRM